MIDVVLLGIIRRWYIRDRVSIREIARRLDISRNTVRRYIRSEAIEPSYPNRRSSSSLDEYAPPTLYLACRREREVAQTKKNS